MCGYFCTGFTSFMINNKGLADFTDFFHEAIKKYDEILSKTFWEKISKYTSKYVNVFEFCTINLVVISVTSKSLTIKSFITAIGAPLGAKVCFLLYFINLKNKFVKSFSVKLKNTKRKHKNFKY